MQISFLYSFAILPLYSDHWLWIWLIFLFLPIPIALLYWFGKLIIEVIWPLLRDLFDFRGRKLQRLRNRLRIFTEGRYEKALRCYSKEKYGETGYYVINGLNLQQVKELLEIPEKEWEETEKREIRKEKQIEERYAEIKKLFPHGLASFRDQHDRYISNEEVVNTPIETFEDLERKYTAYLITKRRHEELQSCFTTYYKQISNYLEASYVYHENIGIDIYGNEQLVTFSYPQAYVYGYSKNDKLCSNDIVEFKDTLSVLTEVINCKTHLDTIKEQRIIGLLKSLHFPYAYIVRPEICSNIPQCESYHFGRIKELLTELGTRIITKDDFSNLDLNGRPVVILDLVSTIEGIKEVLDDIINPNNLYCAQIVYVSYFKEYSQQELKIIISAREYEEEYKRKEEERVKQMIRTELEEEFQKGLAARVEEEYKHRKINLPIIDENERIRLNHLSLIEKPGASDIREYLNANKIKYFYHFTDRRNIDSIKKYGGLLSWQYCVNNGIIIPKPGGDDLSRNLDTYNGLSDYVRCSFCRDLPMMHTLFERGYDLVLLRIDASVACFEGTLFSNMNATDNQHQHGELLRDLKKVNLDAVYSTYVGKYDDYFKLHQAEVLVKTFIPIRYISFPDFFGKYKREAL